MVKLPDTRTLLNESREFFNKEINELDFDSEEAYKEYASKHTVRDGTKVKIGDKEITHGEKSSENSKEKTSNVDDFLGPETKTHEFAEIVYDNYDEMFPDQAGERDEEQDFPDELIEFLENYAESWDLDFDELLDNFTEEFEMAGEGEEEEDRD
jgi:hypothetical protein